MDVRTPQRCDGPNPTCRAAARDGRPWHIIGAPGDPIPPTHHFATPEDAVAAWAEYAVSAFQVHDDEDLFAARDHGWAYRLPVGWVDPTRRDPATAAALMRTTRAHTCRVCGFRRSAHHAACPRRRAGAPTTDVPAPGGFVCGGCAADEAHDACPMVTGCACCANVGLDLGGGVIRNG